MPNETAFTEAQQQEFQQGLVAELKAREGVADVFCKCWPCAKSVLDIILKVPKLPMFAAIVVRAILKAGDIAQAAVCKQ